MIKLLTQVTEFYCTTENEADETLLTRKKESLGSVMKHSTEVKDNYVKLVIKEEYNTAIELQKQEPEDENDYYEMFDGEMKVIEHVEGVED